MGRATLGTSWVAVASVALVAGHGSLVYPRPRNSIDYLVGVNAQWYNAAFALLFVVATRLMGCRDSAVL